MIYIAGPFFNPKQLLMIEAIEKCLGDHGLKYYSPRSDGVLIDLTEEQRQNMKKAIYNKNVEMIEKSSKMIAVIDDRDVGTIWEMGYARACNIPTVTISNEAYGLNVMLAESVQAHVLNLNDAIKALSNPTFRGELLTGVY
jgi:nucleoside 2-deoxyribosyltransferase